MFPTRKDTKQLLLVARVVAFLLLWRLPPRPDARKLLRSLELQTSNHLTWWIWIFIMARPFIGNQADLIGVVYIGLTPVPLVLFPGFRRRAKAEFERLAGTGRPSVSRLLLLVPPLVLTIVAIIVIPFDQPQSGPPFSMSALVGAFVFLAVWWRTGRIGCYHLIAAIASALAVMIFSAVIVGNLLSGYDGFCARPIAAVFAWTGLLLFVWMLDGQLLRELRKVVNPAFVYPTNPYGRAPNLMELLACLWKWASTPPKEQ